MSLGNDHQTCTTEFVDAMRARLDSEQPPLGANVDSPDVRKNFEALGEAVFQILSARAETTSGSAQDAVFWTWVTKVTEQLVALTTWQAGVRTAVQNWSPPDSAGIQLRSAILALAVPPAAPATAPAALTGRVR
jgi:hypothetical protein